MRIKSSIYLSIYLSILIAFLLFLTGPANATIITPESIEITTMSEDAGAWGYITATNNEGEDFLYNIVADMTPMPSGEPLISTSGWAFLQPGQTLSTLYFVVNKTPVGEYTSTVYVEKSKKREQNNFWELVERNEIPVRVTVVPPKIDVSPLSAEVTAQECTTPPIFSFTVWNEGITAYSFYAVYGEHWMNFTNLGLGHKDMFYIEPGQIRSVTVGFDGWDQGVATYEGDVIITSMSAPTVVATLPFTVRFVPSSIVLDPTELDVNVKKCSLPPPAYFAVKNEGDKTFWASATSDKDWIRTSHDGPFEVKPGRAKRVDVYLEVGDFEPGTYTGNINVKACSTTVTLPVKVHVIDTECAVLKYVSGDAQTGAVCKTLTNPFVVAVENENEVRVDWEITHSPEGSGPVWAGDMTLPEGSRILYKKYLKLGSRTGEYYAHAVCPDCTGGSPQSFRATAKCPDVPPYYQNDARWGGDFYANTDQYIKNKGCATTSIAMVMGRYGSTATPKEWDDFMADSGGYDSKANVDWRVPPNIEERLERVLFDKSSNPLSNSLMDPYLERCVPVIVKVVNPSTNSWHWVVVTGKVGGGYSINDPGYGARTTLSAYNNEIYAIQVYEVTNGGCQ